MRHFHLPVWLGQVHKPRGATFASLFTLAASARTVLTTVLPLEAHRLLGDAQRVSTLYFSISIIGVLTSLSIPWLVRRLRRRWVFTVGCAAMAGAAGLFAVGRLPSLVAGLAIYVFAAACLEITLNLYLLDHIRRRDLSRFEPFRVFFAAAAWLIGPWLGVYLSKEVAPAAPFALSAVMAGVVAAYFWFLRLSENPAVAAPLKPPPSPIRYLPRFFVQPRLRLAYFLAFARSGWWSTFFIYAPLYAVGAGLGEVVSGAIVSLAMGSLFLVPVWGALGRRFGMRRLLVVAYSATGLGTIAVAAVADWAWAGAAALVVAGFLATLIDGAGNVPFLRAVRPLERPEMTTVFATYRDAGQMVPPGVFSLVLKVLPLPAVFVAAGGAMMAAAWLARFVPRRL